MRSEKEIEFEIGCLESKLRKGGLTASAILPIRMQIRYFYWVLEREIKGKYHWSLDG